MYATMRPRNTTLIDELPDLEDVESGFGNKYQGDLMPSHIDQRQIFRNKIRQAHSPPPESGMGREHGAIVPHNPQQQMLDFPMMEDAPPAPQGIQMPPNSPSCLDVCSHVMNCPICSKFYNNDRTMYIIAIIFLSVICIILLKKVLDI